MEYETLVVAIIKQAVKDYRRAYDESDIDEIERFFLSDWFQTLTSLDSAYLVQRLRKEKSRKMRLIVVQ